MIIPLHKAHQHDKATVSEKAYHLSLLGFHGVSVVPGVVILATFEEDDLFNHAGILGPTPLIHDYPNGHLQVPFADLRHHLLKRPKDGQPLLIRHHLASSEFILAFTTNPHQDDRTKFVFVINDQVLIEDKAAAGTKVHPKIKHWTRLADKILYLPHKLTFQMVAGEPVLFDVHPLTFVD